MSSPSGGQQPYAGGFSQPGPHYSPQDPQAAQQAFSQGQPYAAGPVAHQQAFSQGQPYGADPRAFSQGQPHASNPAVGQQAFSQGEPFAASQNPSAPGAYGSSVPGTAGGFGQPQAPKQPSAFGLREILLAAGAFLVFVSMFLPQYKWGTDSFYADDYEWLWSFSLNGSGILMLGILPVLAAGLIGVLNKTVRSFPQRIGSFSPDQFVTALAVSGAAVQFVRFIHLFSFSTPSWGAFIGLLGAGLAAFVTAFTMIPALGASEFDARESVPAHPKARPVRRAPVQAPAVQPGFAQTGPVQPGPAQGAPAQNGLLQNGPAEGGPAQPGFAQQGPVQPGPGQQAQNGSAQSGSAQPGFAQPVAPAAAETAEPAAPAASESAEPAAPAADASAASSAPAAFTPVPEDPATPSAEETHASEAAGLSNTANSAGSNSAEHHGRESELTASEDRARRQHATEVSGASADESRQEQPQPVREEPVQEETQLFQPFQLPQSEQPEQEETQLLEQSQRPQPQQTPFWFAVPEPRTAVEASGQPVFQLEPGKWILALEDNGDTFTVQSEDGQIGELRNIHGVERG
ncbi:MAG TPA: hypothetical protein K8U86_07750 [Brevibacterium ravenspurgense]|nr:hypothetical protein [Brevibacterium ravenspurgense]